MCAKCKKCAVYRSANQYGIEPPEHNCVINWVGASGAMEDGATLETVINLWNDSDDCLFIEYLVSDDNSSMRSHLKHIENGGKLLAGVPKPSFLADRSHRIKPMCSPVYKMISNTKDPNRCKKFDFLRVKSIQVATYIKTEPHL